MRAVPTLRRAPAPGDVPSPAFTRQQPAPPSHRAEVYPPTSSRAAPHLGVHTWEDTWVLAAHVPLAGSLHPFSYVPQNQSSTGTASFWPAAMLPAPGAVLTRSSWSIKVEGATAPVCEGASAGHTALKRDRRGVGEGRGDGSLKRIAPRGKRFGAQLPFLWLLGLRGGNVWGPRAACSGGSLRFRLARPSLAGPRWLPPYLCPGLGKPGGEEVWGASGHERGRRALLPGLGAVPNILTQGFDHHSSLHVFVPSGAPLGAGCRDGQRG